MSKKIDVAYIFKKNNCDLKVIDFVTGRYDPDSEKFITSNGRVYNYMLFASKEGFGLRENISSDLYDMYYRRIFVDGTDFMNNNCFYYDMDNDNFCLYWVIGKDKIKCIDKDLINFNEKYKSMCNDIKLKEKNIKYKKRI